MAKKSFETVPFPPLVVVDTDEPLRADTIQEIADGRAAGVTLCIRSQTGHQNRGGYFFHFLNDGEAENAFTIYNFEKVQVAKLSLEHTTEFINHCSGLAFSEWALQFCQSVINFTLDPE